MPEPQDLIVHPEGTMPEPQGLIARPKDAMPAQQGLHGRSVFQFLYSGAGLALCWGAAALGIASTLIAGLGGRGTFLFSAAGMALSGALFIPPLVYAFLHMLGKPSPTRRLPALNLLATGALLLGWALCIALAYTFSSTTQPDSLLLVPVFLLAVCLPVLLLAWAAVGGLKAGSRQRGWGLLTTGMLLSPAIVLSIQVIFGLLGLVIVAVYLGANPDALNGLEVLAQRVVTAGEDVELIQRILLSYLRKPGVLSVLLVYLAVFTPLVEEAFKTAGLWLAGIRPGERTPAAGFAGGALCGAGFALVESLGASGAVTGQAWAGVTMARGGTDLLHIFTGAVMGWALVTAWDQHKYLRLLAAYLGVVLLHGLWNFLSLGTGILPLLNQRVDIFSSAGGSENLATAGLVLLALGMLYALLRINHRLRNEDRNATAQPVGIHEVVDTPAIGPSQGES